MTMYTTYELFNDVLDLRNVVDDFFRGGSWPFTRRVDFPYVNLYEKDDGLEIRALVPGVNASDIDVRFEENSIVIEGERKIDYQDRPYIRKERDFGTFKKLIRLPFQADRNSIKANLADGVLVIALSKSEEAKPKKIEIN